MRAQSRFCGSKLVNYKKEFQHPLLNNIPSYFLSISPKQNLSKWNAFIINKGTKIFTWAFFFFSPPFPFPFWGRRLYPLSQWFQELKLLVCMFMPLLYFTGWMLVWAAWSCGWQPCPQQRMKLDDLWDPFQLWPFYDSMIFRHDFQAKVLVDKGVIEIY